MRCSRRLPTLKALMTSGDDLTIQNGAAEFWRLSGADLFVLADPDRPRGRGLFKKRQCRRRRFAQGLKTLLASPDKHYLIAGGSLYACSLRPLYFGSEQEGTLLGYVVSGVSIERTVREISQPTGVEAAFLSAGQIVASTLAPAVQASLARQSPLLCERVANAGDSKARRHAFSLRAKGSLIGCNLSSAVGRAQILRAGRALDQPH